MACLGSSWSSSHGVGKAPVPLTARRSIVSRVYPKTAQKPGACCWQNWIWRVSLCLATLIEPVRSAAAADPLNCLRSQQNVDNMNNNWVSVHVKTSSQSHTGCQLFQPTHPPYRTTPLSLIKQILDYIIGNQKNNREILSEERESEIIADLFYSENAIRIVKIVVIVMIHRYTWFSLTAISRRWDR